MRVVVKIVNLTHQSDAHRSKRKNEIDRARILLYLTESFKCRTNVN